jgi:hypothetical protein
MEEGSSSAPALVEAPSDAEVIALLLTCAALFGLVLFPFTRLLLYGQIKSAEQAAVALQDKMNLQSLPIRQVKSSSKARSHTNNQSELHLSPCFSISTKLLCLFFSKACLRLLKNGTLACLSSWCCFCG